MNGICCPTCEGPTYVIDSRGHDGYIRRRRECEKCGLRFSTAETIYDPEGVAGRRTRAKVLRSEAAINRFIDTILRAE